MGHVKPHVIILAGPNGAGKSTAAPHVVNELFGVVEFVNADVIAQGLAGFAPDRVALQAGRIMLQRIQRLSERRESFSFETTLSSRALARTIQHLRDNQGYTVYLVYLWLSSADLAVARVADRVASGGHSIPEDAIRRRYDRSIDNFLRIYREMVDAWRVYDNSNPGTPQLIAKGDRVRTLTVRDDSVWRQLAGGQDV
ncbi:MAG: Zeta toxin family protein [Candidatus Hydrogenedentes bacterium]|nr:Zeta toxin family protein [Candidatus Hydrogenedentota bacterium]